MAFKNLLIIAFCVLAYPDFCSSQNLKIFGGRNNEVFLGCMNCGKFDVSSIWNSSGLYGSEFSSASIWNESSSYGGDISFHSPFNKFSTSPPIIVDEHGNFYGYFTANVDKTNRTEVKLALYIVDNWREIKGDLDGNYDKIFKK